MNRTPIRTLLLAASAALPLFAFAQKSQIVQEHGGSSGKSSIQESGGSSGKESVREERSSYSEPAPSYSEPSRSYSEPTPSYSEPTPSYSEPSRSYSEPTPSYSEPKQSYESAPAYSEPKPYNGAVITIGSKPRPSQGGSGADSSPEAQPEARPGRIYRFDDGVEYQQPRIEPSLTTVRQSPVPAPLVATGSAQPKPAVTPGALTSIDSVSVGSFGGSIVGPPPRPDFNSGANGSRPKPLPSQSSPADSKPVTGLQSQPSPTQDKPDPVLVAEPSPAASPQAVTPDDQSGGGILGASAPDDPIAQYEDYIRSGYTSAGPMLDRRLACVYEASDTLVSLYREPRWCQADFDADYDYWIKQYFDCYNTLPKDLVDPWMWPCLLTFMEERSFWMEECGEVNPELAEVRNYLRTKATFVPLVMVSLNAQNREDWAYVDTAFAGPYGGRNYYGVVEQFEAREVATFVRRWAKEYPVIRTWPSYKAVESIYSQYRRSAMRSMLGYKARSDYRQEADLPTAICNARNSAWLVLAILAIDDSDSDMQGLKADIKNFLKNTDPEWEGSELQVLL